MFRLPIAASAASMLDFCVAGTLMCTMPANCPHIRVKLLSSQLPPCASTISDKFLTMPGRSGANTVKIIVSILGVLFPTFGMYDVYSKIFRVKQIKIRYDKNLQLDFHKLGQFQSASDLPLCTTITGRFTDMCANYVYNKKTGL